MPEKTHLKFPCEFPIKIMGPANSEFEARILGIIHKHAPDMSETSITTRLSKDGKYQSITVTINATSKEQLDAIYLEITKDKDVLMAL